MLYIVLDDEVFQKKDDESFNISISYLSMCNYAVPRYVQTDHLLLKRDLYGFVVVLSQIITRRGDARTNERSKPHTEPMMAPQ